MGLDDRFRSFSPGTALLTYVFQWAISAGRIEGDFLRGEHDFKARLRRSGARSTPCGCFAPAAGATSEERPLGETMDNAVLAAGLGAAEIVQRGELPAMSSENCEIVTCRMSDGRSSGFSASSGRWPGRPRPTHSFGLGYEASVYDEILAAWTENVPPLHGFFLDEAAARSWSWHWTISKAARRCTKYGSRRTISAPPRGGSPVSSAGARRPPCRRFSAATIPSTIAPGSAGRPILRAGLHPRYPWLTGIVRARPAPPAGHLGACDNHPRRVPGKQYTRLRRALRCRPIGSRPPWLPARSTLPALLGAGRMTLPRIARNNIVSFDGPTARRTTLLCVWRPRGFSCTFAGWAITEPGEDSESTITAVEELAPLAERFAELDR